MVIKCTSPPLNGRACALPQKILGRYNDFASQGGRNGGVISKGAGLHKGVCVCGAGSDRAATEQVGGIRSEALRILGGVRPCHGGTGFNRQGFWIEPFGSDAYAIR